MSETEQTQTPEDFIPNPRKVRAAFGEVKAQRAEEHAPAIADAQAKLAEANAANTFWAKRQKFREERVSIDDTHQKAQALIDAQTDVISSQLAKLLEQSSKIEKGALKKAKVRAAAQAQAIQDEVEELTVLRDALATLIEEGIEIPHVDINLDGVIDEQDAAALDVDGDGTLDADDIALLDARISELQEKVANDPVLLLLTKQMDAIQAGITKRGEQMDQAADALEADQSAWSAELAEKKEGIDTEAKAVVAAHRATYNEVSGAKDAALAEVDAEAAQAVAAERADLDEYRTNRTKSKVERRINTINGVWEGIQKAWETVAAGFNQKTTGEAANDELLAARKAAAEAGTGNIPAKRRQP